MSVLIGGLCFLLCVTIVLCRPEINIKSRIVGGTNASPGEFPYQVSLRDTNRYFCGGSIISHYSILTAAHCIYGYTNNVTTAVVGTNTLNSGGIAYPVTDFIYHSSYDPATQNNDIAILIVATSITYGTYIDVLGIITLSLGPAVRKIELADTNPAENTTLILTGWGITSNPGNVPNNLQKLERTALDLQTCLNELESGPNPVTTGELCTAATPDAGACNGDSGSPLVEIDTDQQVGILSWGVPCAEGYPDVYTSVAFYLNWINANAILD